MLTHTEVKPQGPGEWSWAAPHKVSPKLRADAFWSVAANLGGLISSIAIIKVITLLVPAGQYGEASLVLGVAGLLTLFLLNPLLSSHLRLYFDHLRSGTARQYAHSFRTRLLAGVGAALAVYVSLAVAYQLAGSSLYVRLLAPAAVLLLGQALQSLTTAHLEAHRQYRALALATFLAKAGQLPILLALLATALPPSHAVVLCQGLAFLTIPLLFRRHAETPASSVLETAPSNGPSALGFSAWLYAANLFSWVLTTSDRYLIQHYLRLEDVGIYALNYGLWSFPYQFLNGWSETLLRARSYGRAAQGDWRGVRRIFLARLPIVFALGSAGAVALYFIGQPIALRLLGPHYWTGKALMMAIVAGHVFFAVGNAAVSAVMATKDTRLLFWANLAAGVTNVAANLLLIPRMGTLGAGVSTLVSYVVWALLLVGLAHHTLGRLVANTPSPTPSVIESAG